MSSVLSPPLLLVEEEEDDEGAESNGVEIEMERSDFEREESILGDLGDEEMDLEKWGRENFIEEEEIEERTHRLLGDKGKGKKYYSTIM